MTPFTMGGITFTVDGLTGLLATAVATGVVIGSLLVVLTLAYGRVGR